MQVVVYNKLVRDKIPQIIEQSGKRPIYRKLNDTEMQYALREKLLEEMVELYNADTIEQLIEEMADILEVLDAIRERFNIARGAVNMTRRTKAIEKGIFADGIYLEEVRE